MVAVGEHVALTLGVRLGNSCYTAVCREING